MFNQVVVKTSENLQTAQDAANRVIEKLGNNVVSVTFHLQPTPNESRKDYCFCIVYKTNVAGSAEKI